MASSSSSPSTSSRPTSTSMGKKKSSFHEDMLDALGELTKAKTGTFITSQSTLSSSSFQWSETFNKYASEGAGIFDDEASLVSDKLWVGSFKSAMNVPELKKRDIRWILTCAGSLIDTEKPGTVLTDVIINHGALIIDDVSEEDLLINAQSALGWIEDALLDERGGSVLVHCAQGKSRSVTVVILFLVTRMGMSVNDALAHVQKVRRGADPNPGFMEQLRALKDSDGDLDKAAALYSHRRSESVVS